MRSCSCLYSRAQLLLLLLEFEDLLHLNITEAKYRKNSFCLAGRDLRCAEREREREREREGGGGE